MQATRIGFVDEIFIPADTIVLGTQRRANDELYDSLYARIDELYLVGDAVHPRTVAEATTDGAAAARSLAGVLNLVPGAP